MKELTATFNTLLQDKRVRSEQSKYEGITRQRSSVMTKYKRIYQEFLDLEAGLQSAKQWYSEMKDTVDSLDKNVETFVNNRRSEGAQLLSQIEQDRASSASGQADRERERLRGLMERMSMDPSTSPSSSKPPRNPSVTYTNTSPSARYPTTNFAGQYQVPSSPPGQQAQHPQSSHNSYVPPQNGSFYPTQQQARPETYSGHKPAPLPQQASYNPGTYPPVSPPPTQTSFSQSQIGYNRPMHQPINQQFVPHGYVPPPPPPGPPPLGPQQTFQQPGGSPSTGHGEYGYGAPPQQQQQQRGPQQGDPWAGLNAWK